MLLDFPRPGGLEVIFGQNLQTPEVEWMAKLGKTTIVTHQSFTSNAWREYYIHFHFFIFDTRGAAI